MNEPRLFHPPAKWSVFACLKYVATSNKLFQLRSISHSRFAQIYKFEFETVIRHFHSRTSVSVCRSVTRDLVQSTEHFQNTCESTESFRSPSGRGEASGSTGSWVYCRFLSSTCWANGNNWQSIFWKWSFFFSKLACVTPQLSRLLLVIKIDGTYYGAYWIFRRPGNPIAGSVHRKRKCRLLPVYIWN